MKRLNLLLLLFLLPSIYAAQAAQSASSTAIYTNCVNGVLTSGPDTFPCGQGIKWAVGLSSGGDCNKAINQAKTACDDYMKNSFSSQWPPSIAKNGFVPENSNN